MHYPYPILTMLLASTCLGMVMLNAGWAYLAYIDGCFTSTNPLDMIRAYGAIVSIIVCTVAIITLAWAGYELKKLHRMKEGG